VTLSDVTRTGVLAAVDEFDRVGREAFLKATGFGPARAYFLEHDGKLYDSKAVIGYAHGGEYGCSVGTGRLQRRRQDGGPATGDARVHSAQPAPRLDA